MHIAAYVRVSTDDQNEQRQMRAIRGKYENGEANTSNEIDWYCDLGESGASTSRREYQRLRENVGEYNVVVAHELDRLGRSFADLAGFVEDLREKGVDIDLVNQPIGTVGEDDWMAEMMLNMMMVFADAERKMIRSRVQEGIDAAIANGKRVGCPPLATRSKTDSSSRFLRSTSARKTSSAKSARAVRSKPLPRSSTFQPRRFGVFSPESRRTTTFRSTTTSGGSNARRPLLAKRNFHHSLLGTNRTDYSLGCGTVVIPDKTYGTALTEPQGVIQRATPPTVCLSGDPW